MLFQKDDNFDEVSDRQLHIIALICLIFIPFFTSCTPGNNNSNQALDFSEVVAMIDEFGDQAEISLVLHDFEGQELLNIMGEKRVPSASVIKIAILAELLNQADAGILNLEKEHVLLADEIVGGAGELQHKPAGGRYSLEYLAREMIRVSDNTATNVLIREVGMDNVNRFTKSLGLSETQLNRYMMDFDAIAEGRQNYTSASDMNLLLLALMENQILSEASRKLMIEMLLDCADSTLIQRNLPPNIRVAHKTGTLAYVRGDAAIVFTEKPYILTIFAENFEELNEAEVFIGELSKRIYKIMSSDFEFAD